MPRLRGPSALIFQRWGWHLMLALSLLLMQQGALRHALQHASNEDAAPAHSTLCKECLNFCAGDALVQPATVAPVLGGRFELPCLSFKAQRIAAVQTGYLSRAPPALS